MTSIRCLTLLTLCAAAAAARADDLLVVDDIGRLRRLDTTTGALGEPRTLKGVSNASGGVVVATHPDTGVVYGLGHNILVTIDAATGWMTQLGPEFWAGADYDAATLDIDPAANQIRALVHVPFTNEDGYPSSETKMLRFDAATGAPIGPGFTGLPAAVYVETSEPLLAGLSIAHAPDGTVFGIDSGRDRLFRFGTPPEDGVATQLPLAVWGVNLNMCLEILPDGTAWLLKTDQGANFDFRLGVYRLDLADGRLTRSTQADLVSVLDVTAAPPALDVPERALPVRRAVVRFDFVRSNRDSIEIRGTLPERVEGWEATPVRACIQSNAFGAAHVNRQFVLDSRGRASADGDSFSVGTRAKAGLVPFVLKVSRTKLTQFPIDSTTPAMPLHPAVDLLVDGHPFHADFEMRYSRVKGSRGRRGVAVKVRSAEK